ncbi:signal peptide peptidase SppA [Taklimakanibacter albus]|uniref:Signal peptide peptidase SppA n=1 Tax=Taklimakanibacter albus TaxID=2800327 RepID=A0ACC5RED7_9HYPH|nr:signal peptide peptidase SppA [Aestuariivirga sp. YIM B02566]MBK1871018.1 signal peptide peptidase SppA [Aestuariivirga sp. YIM B02566]
MASEAELIIDRRRLKRRLTFWRVASVLLFIGAVLALAAATGGFNLEKRSDHIARVWVTGLITGDQPTLDLLEDIAKADNVKGLIIRIDSPGGTTAGSEAIYEAIRKIAKDKPVAAVMDTVAASGGYITAIAADHIVARGNTITGSIGVIFQWAEFSKLLETVGVQMQEIKSGDLKAEPSPFKPLSEKAREVSTLMVQDSFAWFTGLVAERRKLPLDKVKILSDGRVYTGRQAVAEKLIDELGGEEKAVAWIKKEKKLSDGIEVKDWALPSEEKGLFGLGLRITSGALKAMGLPDLAKQAQLQKLDGLVSVWHPSFQ